MGQLVHWHEFAGHMQILSQVPELPIVHFYVCAGGFFPNIEVVLWGSLWRHDSAC